MGAVEEEWSAVLYITSVVTGYAELGFGLAVEASYVMYSVTVLGEEVETGIGLVTR